MLNIIGNFQDPINKVEGVNRKFVFNRGSLDAKRMLWNLDLMEIIEVESSVNPVQFLSLSIQTMSFTAIQNGTGDYEGTIVSMSTAAQPFTVDLTDALWADYKVYAGGVDITTTPSFWGNGCELRIYPASQNSGAERTGTVRVLGIGVDTVDISVLQEVNGEITLSSSSMAFDDLADSYEEYQETTVSIVSGTFSVDMTDAIWAEYRVYSDESTDITSNPSIWTNGCRVRIFPIDANGGPMKTGLVHINTVSDSADISVTHQAAPARVVVRAGNFAVMTISGESGIISGGIQIAFTPHYVPDDDPTFDVCWLIKINDVEAYSSEATGHACTQDIAESMQLIDTGSLTWNDGDLIDVYLYYELAPALS